MQTTRRDFVAISISSAMGAKGARPNQLDRLACNSWPLRGYFDTPQMANFRDKKYPLLTQEEFPQFLADHLGIHNVEFLPQHFVDTNTGTIERVKAGLKKAHARCCNLMGVEFSGGVFDKNANIQTLTAEAERWAGVAAALGSPSMTVALNGKQQPDATVAATNLAPVVDVASKHGIQVLFHNDNIKTEYAELLTAVIGKLGRTQTGMCPDFGNFATRSADYALSQLKMLAPYASGICHSKDGIADNGVFYIDNFPASMKVMRDAGFKGLYSLEYEGLGAPLDGLRKLLTMTTDHLR